MAACINGTSARALDFDDSFAPVVTHASAILVPSFMTIAQAEGLSGRDLVDAYLIEPDKGVMWIARKPYEGPREFAEYSL